MGGVYKGQEESLILLRSQMMARYSHRDLTAKRLKGNTPERMDRARAERDALQRLKTVESPHIKYFY
jgi:hypothetical protein